MNKLIEKARDAKRESKYIEFKSEFNPNSKQDWCEIIKDITAIANSGGGIILFGVDNKGIPTSYDRNKIIELDSADINNKMGKYVGNQDIDMEIIESEKNGKKGA